MGVLTNRTITRNEKVNGDVKEVWKWKGDIQLVMDDKAMRDEMADEQALIRLAECLRVKDYDEVRDILREPVKYSAIGEMLDAKRTGRGRPSAEKQVEAIENPEEKARAMQMVAKLKAMGLRI